MKLDFWQVTEDPVETVVALIARRVADAGERLLVVSQDEAQRVGIARALWQAGPESFLANGAADAAGAERQPILLAADCTPANGATHLVLADGIFRETEGFSRVFLLFSADGAPAARAAWRAQDDRSDVTRAYYEQQGGRWVKKA
ncbi:MAG: DNA polymerase III subunit chi [Porphyrobacter sp.]|nr:DNA polymerase III subunit chi [Porphyrobacter sp.]